MGDKVAWRVSLPPCSGFQHVGRTELYLNSYFTFSLKTLPIPSSLSIWFPIPYNLYAHPLLAPFGLLFFPFLFVFSFYSILFPPPLLELSRSLLNRRIEVRAVLVCALWFWLLTSSVRLHL